MSAKELANWKKLPRWLKNLVLYVIPAFGTLYFTLSTIWSLPYGEQILGTCTAVQLFLGASLGIKIKQN